MSDISKRHSPSLFFFTIFFFFGEATKLQPDEFQKEISVRVLHGFELDALTYWTKREQTALSTAFACPRVRDALNGFYEFFLHSIFS